MKKDKEPQRVYRLPLSYVLRFFVALLLRQERDMGADTAGTLMSVRPRPQVLGDEFIPVHDPFVLVANHYERPGLRVYWGGTLVSFAVSQKRQDRLHWLMTSEWRNYRLGPVPVPVWFLRWLFRRIARVYGLIIVPRASEKGVGRAAAMRSILNVAEKQREPIALFPEAIGHGKLIRPPAAVGAFLLLLSEHGLPMLPVGIYEDDGVLSARFGEPFFVDVRGIGKEKRAEAARDQVMVAIGRLLPPHLWGAYSAEVAQEIGPLPGERPHGGLP